jgi:hypothetical protein
MRMKNKTIEQAAARKRHKERLKAKRRKEPTLDRGFPGLIEKPSILIVCEGENTEPTYFDQFKVKSATVKSVGTGYNTVSLVKRAKEIADSGEYDQVWCVFDKDQFPDQDFNQAIMIAESYNYGVAYSNQAFEYWLILHLDDHQGGRMSRDSYNDKINELLRPFHVEYDGGSKGCKIVSDDFFDILLGIDHKSHKKRVDLAIERAERIYNSLDHFSPAKEESSTTVFKLVRELIKYT